MKIFLTLSNIVLAGFVLWAVSGFFRAPSAETVYTLGRDRDAVTETRSKVAAAAPAALSIDDAANLVTRYNLFNISRCPDAVSGRGRPQARQMTLIGIYKVGNAQGAIIQQTPQRAQGQGGAAGAQQAEKRFYQVGEVLSNGYTLAAIDDGKVTLSRGGSTMDLQLESAGRNITTASAAAQTRRPTLQQTQQFMMMNMMQQMMQQNRMIMQQSRNQQQQPQGQIPAARQNQSQGRSNTARR